MVKLVREMAGIQGKANHDLSATGATRLFAANVPIHTGHRSTTAFHIYERTSIQQQQSVLAQAPLRKLVSEIPMPHTGPGSKMNVPGVKNLRLLLTIVKLHHQREHSV